MASGQTSHIVLVNLPPSWTTEHLRSFVELLTAVEIKEDGVHTFKDITHTALLSLEKPIPAEAVDQMDLTRMAFMGRIIKMRAVTEPTRTILVHYKDPDPDITRADIRHPFDTPECQKMVDVDDVRVYPEALLIAVRFSKPEDVETALHYIETHHESAFDMGLERCYEEFHVPLLKEIRTKTSPKKKKPPIPQKPNIEVSPTRQSHPAQQSPEYSKPAIKKFPGFGQPPFIGRQTAVSGTGNDAKATEQPSGFQVSAPQQTSQTEGTTEKPLKETERLKILKENAEKLGTEIKKLKHPFVGQQQTAVSGTGSTTKATDQPSDLPDSTPEQSTKETEIPSQRVRNLRLQLEQRALKEITDFTIHGQRQQSNATADTDKLQNVKDGLICNPVDLNEEFPAHSEICTETMQTKKTPPVPAKRTVMVSPTGQPQPAQQFPGYSEPAIKMLLESGRQQTAVSGTGSDAKTADRSSGFPVDAPQQIPRTDGTTEKLLKESERLKILKENAEKLGSEIKKLKHPFVGQQTAVSGTGSTTKATDQPSDLPYSTPEQSTKETEIPSQRVRNLRQQTEQRILNATTGFTLQGQRQQSNATTDMEKLLEESERLKILKGNAEKLGTEIKKLKHPFVGQQTAVSGTGSTTKATDQPSDLPYSTPEQSTKETEKPSQRVRNLRQQTEQRILKETTGFTLQGQHPQSNATTDMDKLNSVKGGLICNPVDLNEEFPAHSEICTETMQTKKKPSVPAKRTIQVSTTGQPQPAQQFPGYSEPAIKKLLESGQRQTAVSGTGSDAKTADRSSGFPVVAPQQIPRTDGTTEKLLKESERLKILKENAEKLGSEIKRLKHPFVGQQTAVSGTGSTMKATDHPSDLPYSTPEQSTKETEIPSQRVRNLRQQMEQRILKATTGFTLQGQRQQSNATTDMEKLLMESERLKILKEKPEKLGSEIKKLKHPFVGQQTAVSGTGSTTKATEQPLDLRRYGAPEQYAQETEIPPQVLQNPWLQMEQNIIKGATGFTLPYQQSYPTEDMDNLNNIVDGCICNPVDLNEEFPAHSDRALLVNGLHRMGFSSFDALFKDTLDDLRDDLVNLERFGDIELPAKYTLPRCRFQRRKRGRRNHAPNDGQSRFHGDFPVQRSGSRYVSGHGHSSRRAIFMDQPPVPCSYTVGNTIITVKPGDITTEQVEAAVSVVGMDLNPSDTAVGSAFLNKYPSIAQALQADSQVTWANKRHRVLVTQSYGGSLPMPTVFHAVLNRIPRRAVPKVVKQLVYQCLTLALSSGITSIAFPPIGVGRRFRFGRYTVANVMMTTFQEFLAANPNSFWNISVVVADTNTIETFVQVLEKKFGGMAPDLANPAVAFSDSDDSLASEENDSDADLETVQEDLPEMARGTFGVSVYTRQAQDSQKVISALLKLLKTTFLWHVTLYGYISTQFQKLEAPALIKIADAAAENDVLLSLYEKGLRLCGMKEAVTTMQKMVHAEAFKQRAAKGIRRRNRLGLPVNTEQMPSYWQAVRNPATVFEESRPAQPNCTNKLFSVAPEEHAAVVQLVESTWDALKAGAGKDARNLTHRAIQVRDVKRLENPNVWMAYCQEREQMFRRLEHSATPFEACCTPVEELPYSSGPLMTTAVVTEESPLTRDIYPQVNEHYLFHGTKREALNEIYEQGLNCRKAKGVSMLGKGVYTAESSTKADQYTDPKTTRSSRDQHLTMILARVLLGEPFVQKERNPAKFNRPPCTSCSQTQSCYCSEPRLHDSVIDDGVRIFREFVVYKDYACYPEYFITYNRV